MRALAVAAAVTVLGGVLPAHAQYPQKPVRLIVPYVPGGSPDSVARLLEPRLSAALGQRIVIDNRPGAGGSLGTELAAKAAPDGYNLVLTGVGPLAISTALNSEQTRYDALKDFAYVAVVASSPLILVTHFSLPVRKLKDLITLARRRPGQLSYSSAGNGTPNHLVGEMFKYRLGLEIRHIPYKGGPPALVALISGETELHMGQIPPVAPYLSARRVRALAVSGEKRALALPDIPTFGESGVAGLHVTSWYLLAAPARTPAEIVQALNRELTHMLAIPDVRSRMVAQGTEPVGSTPEEALRFVRDQLPKWAEAVKLSGARID